MGGCVTWHTMPGIVCMGIAYMFTYWEVHWIWHLNTTSKLLLTCPIFTIKVCPWAGCILWFLVIIEVAGVGRNQRFCHGWRLRLTFGLLSYFFCTPSWTIYRIDKQSQKMTYNFSLLVRGKSHKMTDFVGTSCHTFPFVGRSTFFGDHLMCLWLYFSFFGWYIFVSFGLVIVFLDLKYHWKEGGSIQIEICLHINKDEDGCSWPSITSRSTLVCSSADGIQAVLWGKDHRRHSCGKCRVFWSWHCVHGHCIHNVHGRCKHVDIKILALALVH